MARPPNPPISPCPTPAERGGGFSAWLRTPDDPPGAFLAFTRPDRVLSAWHAEEVLPLLQSLDGALASGAHVAGFLAYEAAPGLDPALVTHPPQPNTPLACFGVFSSPPARVSHPFAHPAPETDPEQAWTSAMPRPAYLHAVDRIRDYIAAGDAYQVNFTFQLRHAANLDPRRLFAQLVHAQPNTYAALIETSRHSLCSASPELFFRLDGPRIVCKPMKGTAPRGITSEEDRRLGEELQRSAKNRAENVMIVDMVRNDLGRIARPGSVNVDRLFEIERHPTLFQMTSTVSAETHAPLSEIMHALFPCASITGAPKVRSMEIIAELEAGPRGVYTGCIGWMGPDRRGLFNVAIRTASFDRASGTACYGAGGGIVWDSSPDEEYEEARLKSRVLAESIPPFEILETMRWTPGEGFGLLPRHLGRMAATAHFFGFPFEREAIERLLSLNASSWGATPQRVRLLLDSRGQARVEHAPLPESPHPTPALSAGPARTAVDSRNRFLHHKTTHRTVYEHALAQRPDLDDVLLWNERGEACEFTRFNLVIRRNGRLLTPPESCGLLPGTLRAELLESGQIEEQVIPMEEVERAEEIWAINSVRGWVRVDYRRRAEG